MVKIYCSSVKNYVDWYNLPIINAIKEITKGGLYEEKENEPESFKQIILKNSKTD